MHLKKIAATGFEVPQTTLIRSTQQMIRDVPIKIGIGFWTFLQQKYLWNQVTKDHDPVSNSTCRHEKAQTNWQWEKAISSSISLYDIKPHEEACSYATSNS